MEDDVKQKAKKVIKKGAKKIFWIFLPLMIIVVLLAAAIYFITVDDAIFKEAAWENTNYAASQYINNVSIDSDGKLNTKISADELWDKMKKNDSRVSKYLDNSEELARLMKAEIVTQYLDTRENPDEEVDWKYFVENADELQGIVKLKRADSNGNKTTMKYVSPETFQSYIDEYNKSGSEKAKNDALTHFTLKKTSTGTTGSSATTGVEASTNTFISKENCPNAYNTYLALKDLGLTDASACAIIGNLFQESGGAGTSDLNPTAGNGKTSYGLAQWTPPTAFYSYANQQGLSASEITTQVAYIKYTLDSGHWWTGSTSEKALKEGGYLDRSYSVKEFYECTDLKKATAMFLGYYEECIRANTSYTIDGKYMSVAERAQYEMNNRYTCANAAYTSFAGSSSTGSSSSDDATTEKIANNVSSERGVESNVVGGDGYTQQYTSSSGITYKMYKQFKGSYVNNKYSIGTMHDAGCGPTSVSILASGLVNSTLTAGDVAKQMQQTMGSDVRSSLDTLPAEMQALGMTTEVINNPTTQTIQDNLKNGKVMIAYLDSRTKFTKREHFVTLIDINNEGQVYVGNPGSEQAGLQGWVDPNELTKGCKAIILADTGKTGTSEGAITTNNSSYAAVVATWSQVDTKMKTNDPNVQDRYGIGGGESTVSTEYTMTTSTINYKEMVDKYTVPFDLLWAFMVMGEDKEFVFDFADLIYNSDIQITVYDNLTVNTNIDDWKYTKRTKADVKASIEAKYKEDGKSYTQRGGINHTEDPYGEDINYNTVKTVITKTNTINTVLTKANTWIVDYTNDYTYQAPTETSGSETIVKDNQSYPSTPVRTESGSEDNVSFSCEHIESKKQEVINKVINQYMNNTSDDDDGDTKTKPSSSSVKVTVDFSSVNYYEKYIDISDTLTDKTSTQQYVKGVPELKEKTDEDADEDNFVTIFLKKKNYKNYKNITSAPEWLFEIIETNDSTADMIDLMRYILYKATGVNYGVKEFDFSEFEPNSFSTVSGAGADILMDYLKSWENGTLWRYEKGEISYSKYVSKYITEDKTKYICFTDGEGRLNFGYGMCHYYSGHYNHVDLYSSLGVDIKQYGLGSTIDVEIVNQAKEKFIEGVRQSVNAKLTAAGLSLNENQVNALIAISYQWGDHIVDDFIPAYKKYGDTEALRNNFANGNDSRDKPFLNGDGSTGSAYEVKRGNANWKVFHEGIYTTPSGEVLDTSNYSTGNSTIVQAAVSIHKYVRENGYTYQQRGVTLPNTGGRTIDCSSFVTWVLVDLKVNGFTNGMYQWTSRSFNGNPQGWQVVSVDQAQPGDILVYNGHVEIVAATGSDRFIVYNCGGNSSIRAAGTADLPESSTSGHSKSSITKILRVP